MMGNVEKRLQELGIELPKAPNAAGSYVLTRRHGNVLYVSGMLPLRDGKVVYQGPVGEEQTLEQAQEAAALCIINALAAIQAAVGSLDAIEAVLLLQGFVLAPYRYPDSPKVINGASDLLAKVLGSAGQHARAAIAVGGLPLDATVEVQLTVALRG
ncbi:MAG: endoribonuclease L-PSP [Puniceicoccaceae bacterium 5H]|nr:MAG: endoribonuclease L-PSP [Puniceicoccaceae bacterium 5H]